MHEKSSELVFVISAVISSCLQYGFWCTFTCDVLMARMGRLFFDARHRKVLCIPRSTYSIPTRPPMTSFGPKVRIRLIASNKHFSVSDGYYFFYQVTARVIACTYGLLCSAFVVVGCALGFVSRAIPFREICVS